MLMDLNNIGWNSYFEESFRCYREEGYSAGRIFAQHKNMYRIYSEFGELLGEVSGRFHYDSSGSQDYPTVGDWVAITPRPGEMGATIHGVLGRRSKFSRKTAGVLTEEQVVAANMDYVFIVVSLNENYNIRRVERYLTVAWESGANPVIILSKADLCDCVEDRVNEVSAAAFGVPVHSVSAYENEGLNEIKPYLKEGKTIVLLGSSGVGKSTLVNWLTGEERQLVQEVSELGDRGKHTTTHRELIILPSGALLIDTPGMRELQLWDGSEGISEAFEDIEELSSGCKFSDCNHKNEPGCKIREALRDGSLSLPRFESYLKLQREIRFIEKKQRELERIQEKKGNKRKSNR